MEAIQEELVEVIAELARLDSRLSDLAEAAPNPIFEPATDEPLNVAAEIVGAIEMIHLEAFGLAIPALRRVAELRDSQG